MSIFGVTLCLHVLVAVFGLGQLTAVTIVTRAALTGGAPRPSDWAALHRSLRGIAWSLGLLLVTGIGIDFAASGVFHGTLWFRLSFGLLLVVGFLGGRAQRVLRQSRSLTPELGVTALVRIERIAWTMCGVVALMVVLMVLRP